MASIMDWISAPDGKTPEIVRPIWPSTTLRLCPPTVEVVPVVSRVQRRHFVELPWKVQADDPCWSPPLLSEAYAAIDSRRHPFYRHGTAQPFVAYVDGQPVGRVLVSDDPRFNAEQRSNVGAFGMFESIDDQAVADALLETAADWLVARGRTEMIGPMEYSTNYPTGLLVEGFDQPQRVMLNHNPPYYQALLEGWGCEKAKDLYGWWLDGSCRKILDWSDRAERLGRRAGVTIRPIDFHDFDAEVARCRHVYHTAWEDNWGFVRMTDAEFDHLARNLRRVGVPGLMLLAEVDQEPVGLSITLPDLNEATRPLNGRLTWCGMPIGLLRLLRNLRHIKSARMAVLGVVDGYRRRGIAELLILKTFQYGHHTLGYTGAELGWTLEDNEHINRTIESVGARRYKTYRVYRRDLTR